MKLSSLLISCATLASGLVRRDAHIEESDSCPLPPQGVSGSSLLGPTHSCSWCVSKLARADPIAPNAKWQSVAFRNEATKPVQMLELTPAGTEIAHGLPVAPRAEATFRCQLGTVWRARELETDELLVEHKVGRVRLMAEPPADAAAHDFGVDDADEWRSTKPAPPPLDFKISSAPLARRPKRREAGREDEDDYRFSVSFVNHAAVPLDLYFFNVRKGTETMQATLGPLETRDLATYWGHAFVVRDPASGRRVSQFEIPVIPIRDCRASNAAATAAARLGEPVALTVNATDADDPNWNLAEALPSTVESKSS